MKISLVKQLLHSVSYEIPLLKRKHFMENDKTIVTEKFDSLVRGFSIV